MQASASIKHRLASSMSKLNPPKELNFNAVNVSEEWRRWEKSFQNYYQAAELSEKTRATQVAILLNCKHEQVKSTKRTKF